MKILLWLLFLPAHLLVAILRYPLAPFAVIFFTSNDRSELLSPFVWLGTIDNGLSGDDGWRNENIKKGSDPLSTWNRIRWLWRNGGNWFNYNAIGCFVDSELLQAHMDDQDSKIFWRNKKGYWLLRGTFFKHLYIFWGWSLFGPQQYKCKFTFTTKLK